MRMPWSACLLWTVGTFLLTAGVFALGFTGLGTVALAGTEAYGLGDAFFRAFVFSVGVLTTVGAGPARRASCSRGRARGSGSASAR
jgi:hypothetical protein